MGRFIFKNSQEYWHQEHESLMNQCWVARLLCSSQLFPTAPFRDKTSSDLPELSYLFVSTRECLADPNSYLHISVKNDW